jgi:ABC-type multidrug transport system permease subunit
MRNVYHLAVKEFLHLWRDRRTLVFLLLMPTALTILFGFAIQTSKVSNVKTRVIDLDHGKIAEEYIKDIRTADTFDLTVVDNAGAEDVTRAEEDLQHDRIKAFVVLPADLTANIIEGRKATIRAVVDASDTFSAPAILRELHGVAIRHNLKLAAGYLLYEGLVKTKEQAALRVQPVALDTELRFNPELRIQNFTMPGVIGMILQLLTIIVMATSIARERERGTMEQLEVTPLTGSAIFLGKLVPYFILALVDTVNAMVVARLVFKVELGGHYAVVSALVVVFILGSLGIGQLISAVSKNQGQAVQLAVFYIMPVFVLSGAFAPLETMPANVRRISYLFPLTYFCRSFRAALLRQAGFADVKLDLLAMGAFVVVTFGASVIVLRRHAR